MGGGTRILNVMKHASFQPVTDYLDPRYPILKFQKLVEVTWEHLVQGWHSICIRIASTMASMDRLNRI